MNLDHLVGIFGLLFAVAIAARYTIVSRQIGRPPIGMAGNSVDNFVHRVLAAVVALEAFNIIAFRLSYYAPHLAFYDWLGPFEALRTNAIQGAGLLIAFSGLAWSVAAQAQMGASWRIGNDDAAGAELVRHGLYKISRHPIYLGFMVVTFGLFLATPNAVTLVCAVVAFVGLSICARLEEDFQLKRHGDAYRAFQARTRRWL